MPFGNTSTVFDRKTDTQMVLVDDVRYELPFGCLGRLATGYARQEIDRCLHTAIESRLLIQRFIVAIGVSR